MAGPVSPCPVRRADALGWAFGSGMAPGCREACGHLTDAAVGVVRDPTKTVLLYVVIRDEDRSPAGFGSSDRSRVRSDEVESCRAGVFQVVRNVAMEQLRHSGRQVVGAC